MSKRRRSSVKRTNVKFDDNFDELALSKTKLFELKQMCKDRGLHYGGKKVTLISHLLESCGKTYRGITSVEQKEETLDESELDEISEEEKTTKKNFGQKLTIPGWGRSMNSESFTRALPWASPDIITPWLPNDILYIIFLEVRRGDLVSCGLVCKQWRKVSLDERLGWFEIAQHSISDVTAKYFSDEDLNSIRMLQKKLDPLQHFSISLENKGRDVMQITDKTGAVVGVVDTVNYEQIDPFLWDHTFPYLPRSYGDLYQVLRLAEKDSKLWKVETTFSYEKTKTDNINLVWGLSMCINIQQFDFLVQSNTQFHSSERLFVIQKVNHFILTFLMEFGIKLFVEPHIPQVVYPLKKQPKQLKIKLYQYQLQALSWMQFIEDHVGEELSYSTLAAWAPAKSDTLFDLSNGKFIIGKDIRRYTQKVKLRGGCLADEMGLGKTLTVIGLIMSNPMDVSKSGKKIVLPQHEPTKMPRRLGLTSRASLVHCPSHVARQWKDELEKHTSLKFALITTINEYKSYTCKDLLRMDVVIVSFQFLQNKNYVKMCETFDKSKFLESPSKYIPPLSRIHWHRIILDEGHEIIHGLDSGTKQKKPLMLGSYSSRYRWYCSGTPFPNPKIMTSVLEWLLEIPTTKFLRCFNITHNYTDWVLCDLVINNLYWRNTKESIKDVEYEVPPYKTEVKLIDLHYIERALYNDAEDEAAKLAVCSDPLAVHVSNVASLESIRTAMNAFRQQQRAYFADEVDRLTQNVQLLENAVKAAPPEDRTRCVARLKWTEQRLDEAKDRWEQAKRRCSIWANVEPLHISEEQYQNFDEAESTCMSVSVSKMAVKELRDKLDEEGAESTGTKKELQLRLCSVNLKKKFCNGKDITTEDMIVFAGSKTAHVIQYLDLLWSQKPDSRVIVFSKFPKVLVQIGKYLKIKGVFSAVVEGSVYRRNKAIVSFSNECKVILLGLGTAASGTNLTQASHVILVDPMNGSVQEARSIESQAIARAYRQGQDKVVTIVRFISRDTIEHDRYCTTYGGEGILGEEEGIKSSEEKECLE